MGMDLISVDSKVGFRFNIWAWRNVLALAKQYGWKPLGTQSPRKEFEEEFSSDDDWDGNYLTNDFQLVRSEDAKSMAEALEVALVDMCDSRRPEEHQMNDVIANDPMIKGLREVFGGQGTAFEERFSQMASTSPLAFFRDGGKEKLMEFIDFCKKGAFVIC